MIFRSLRRLAAAAEALAATDMERIELEKARNKAEEVRTAALASIAESLAIMADTFQDYVARLGEPPPAAKVP